MPDNNLEQEWWRVESLDLREMIHEVIMHEIDVITESDWFSELVDGAVKKIVEENRKGENNG